MRGSKEASVAMGGEGEEGFEVAEVPGVRSGTVLPIRVRTQVLTVSVSMIGTPVSWTCYCCQTGPIMVCPSRLNPLL